MGATAAAVTVDALGHLAIQGLTGGEIESRRAIQQGLEIVHSDRNRNRESDRRPERVPSPHPVPKLEHVCRIDAESGHLRFVGREGDEVTGDRGGIAKGFEQPTLRAHCIGNGFLRGERFGSHDEQRGLRPEQLKRLGNLRAVHVRDKMQAHMTGRVGLQRFRDHDRTQIGTANADIHDIGDPFPRPPFPRTAANRLAELPHMPEHGIYPWHHVMSVDKNGPIRSVPERDMEDRPFLGAVDFLPRKHSVTPRLDSRLPGKRQKARHRLGRDAVFGIVDQHLLPAERESFESPRVFCKEIPHVKRRHGVVMFPQGFPRGG